MKYYLALEKKRTPVAVDVQNEDIEKSSIELELALVTTTDDEQLPESRFELVKTYDEIPEEWDRFFPEILPGGRKGAIKRTGMFFGFSGKDHEREKVIDFIEAMMDEKSAK